MTADARFWLILGVLVPGVSCGESVAVQPDSTLDDMMFVGQDTRSAADEAAGDLVAEAGPCTATTCDAGPSCDVDGLCGQEDVDDAAFVEQSVPLEVIAGQSFEASFTLRNEGTLVWSEEGMTRLGSEAPRDNQTWGVGRIEIEEGVEVEPGEDYTFTATLTAPAVPGPHPMQWMMVRDQVHWFGQPTPLVEVTVADPCVGHCGNGRLDCGEQMVDCGVGCGACAPVEIAPPAANGSYARVAAPSPDRVMVIWEHDGQRARWSCFDGQTWTPPAPISEGGGVENNPGLVADDAGIFHGIYSNGLGGGRQVHYARYAAPDCTGAWDEPEVASAGDAPNRSSAFPDVGVDEAGVPYAFWSQSSVPTSDPECDDDGSCPEGYICWETVCKPHVYIQHFSRRLGGTWETPWSLTEGQPGLSHHGALHVRSSQDVHAVWLQGWEEGPQTFRHIYYGHFDGISWSAPEFTNITAHVADVRGDDGAVHVFSCTGEYSTRPAGGGPWEATNVAGGDIGFMSLRQDTTGRLHAVWAKQHRIVYAVKDPGEAWQTPKRVSPDEERYAEPSTVLDPEGFLHIVWARCGSIGCPWEDEHGAIWYLRTRYEDLP